LGFDCQEPDDERKLALVEQDKTASGAASRFFKFVER
jgi:hypothetical protein